MTRRVDMWLGRDPGGFPTLLIAEYGVEMQLLPVTKVQFERFLAEPNQFGDAWYADLLSLNPRSSPATFVQEERERLLLTGVQPPEATAFAAWLGDDWTVPSARTWQQLYSLLAQQAITREVREALLSWQGCSSASAMLREMVSTGTSSTLLDVSLMRGGAFEWVRVGSRWRLLGKPRDQFFRQLFDPVNDKPWLWSEDTREYWIGFRLIREL